MIVHVEDIFPVNELAKRFLEQDIFSLSYLRTHMIM